MPVRGPISTRFRSLIKSVGVTLRTPARNWVLTLLVLVTLAVCLGLSFGERTGPEGWARVWGGPTEGPTPFNVRIELVIPDLARSTAQDRWHARLRLEAEGVQPQEMPLVFDDEAMAYVALPHPLRNPRVSIVAGKHTLAAGPLHLDRIAYWQQRKLREGRYRGKTTGPWNITVGCKEGAFVLGLPGTLAIEIANDAGGGVVTPFILELEGFEDSTLRTPVALYTNEHGRVSIPVVPKDLAASVHIRAGEQTRPIASYFSSIPVAHTSLSGGLRDGKWYIESLIPTRKAYYGLINEHGRWASGVANLDCQHGRSCRAELAIGVQPTLPAWLMVGTEPALDGPGVIGWPVAATDSEFISDAVTIRDQLLLDGKTRALAEAANRSRSRLRNVLIGLAIALAMLMQAVLWPILRSRRQTQGLEGALAKTESARLIEPRSLGVTLVLILILAALAALAAWVRGML